MGTGTAPRGRPELADIFRTHGGLLGDLSAEQRRVVTAITSCRTAALGGHIRECSGGCGYAEISYNSCRDRHCPKCQGLERVRWQEARAADLLPVPYFHVVFTLPDVLHAVFLAHQRVAYGLLFGAVAETLKEVAARPKNLGAEIGLTAVLHTWTQTLLYHPHIHCIVPGGGLRDGRWVAARADFFVAVRILSTVFRGKLLSALADAVAKKRVGARCGGAETAQLLRQAAQKKWVVYCKRPFAGPAQVLAYLGRYTHRIAISNERIVGMDADQVTFAYKDRRNGDRRKELTLPAKNFLRRFLLHVVPSGFVRIRHFGLLANSVRRDRIALCRELLGVREVDLPDAPGETWEAILLRLTGKDVTRCPACGGKLHTTRTIEPEVRRRRGEQHAVPP